MKRVEKRAIKGKSYFRRDRQWSLVTIFMLIACCLMQSTVMTYAMTNLLEDSTLSEDELAIIQEQEVYTVGYTTNHIPISYEIDGVPSGIAIDLLDEVAAATGVQMKYVNVEDPRCNLDSLDLTLIMENFTDKRQSPTYLTHQSVLATRSDHEGDFVKVAVQHNYGLEVIDPRIAEYELQYYSNFLEAKKALDAGVVDGMLMATIGYERVAKEVEEGIYNLEILETPIHFRFSYNNNLSNDKVAIFNDLLGNLNEDNIYFLTQKHSNYMQHTYGMIEEIVANLDEVLIGILIGMMVVSTCIFLIQRRKRKKLEKALDYDELTGLLSEHKFKEEVARIVKHDESETYHILALDMDNFKYINEIYGYAVGTQILREMGRNLYETMPSVDHVMTRTFADNFFVLVSGNGIFKHLNGNEEGYHDAKRVLSKILGEDFNFSFSIGAYTIENPREDVSLMMDCATTARNMGKSTLGYTINPYTDAMRIARKVKNNVVATMDTGVSNREFVIYYQPKIDLTSERVMGAEALVRWVKDGEVIPPNDFIPIFEKNGFIETLDYYVLDTVCRFLHDHQGKKMPVISVNLSGITVMKENLVESIIAVLERNQVKPEQIDLEITESAFVNHFQESIERLERLREYGFTIAMDDFGAGVSSLHRLKEIPLDILKIDREFITDSIGNDKGTAIIENIVHMAKEIHLETVAEGIETKEQLEFLQHIGCDVGQGYYYSRPLPEEEFLQMLG